MSSKYDEMESRLIKQEAEASDRFERLESKMSVLNDTILDLRVEVRSLIERIEAIEGSLKRK